MRPFIDKQRKAKATIEGTNYVLSKLKGFESSDQSKPNHLCWLEVLLVEVVDALLRNLMRKLVH